MTARETLGAQEPVAAGYGCHSAGSDDEDGKLDAVVLSTTTINGLSRRRF